MKLIALSSSIALSSTLALLAVQTSAQVSGSCKSGVIDIALAGDSNPRNYTLSVPEDSRTIPITNPLIVFSITPPYYPLVCPTNCTFIGAEGAITYYNGNTIDVDGPQAQLSVSCTTVNAADALCITATSLSPSEIYSCTASDDNYTGRPRSTSIPSTKSTVRSTAPPYPTITGSGTGSGTSAPSAPASLQPYPTGISGTGSNSTTVSFTGDSRKLVGPIGGSLIAFIGLIWAF